MLRDTFCSSPWFHIRIDPQGNYLPCRWGSHQDITIHNVNNTTISEYMNSDTMRDVRLGMLDGTRQNICSSCYYEDANNKVSGRQRQLLKSVINVQNFEKTLCASPHWQQFEHSYNHHGHTNNQPLDLQIDLGNICNSACVMCFPIYSSRLATDYEKLNLIEPRLFKNFAVGKSWADDDSLIDKFVNEITSIPNIKYIHFIGGETLYLKSFYKICNKLIELGHSKNISIGTTTNCTIYGVELENIIKNFKQVHLGLSIEAFHLINDYVRYPSDINQIKDNIDYFLNLREQTGLHLSLRITPNILSIYHIDSIFEFMLSNKIIAESCNILSEPSHLRIELLPEDLKLKILDKVNKLIADYNLSETNEIIINRRRDDLVDPVVRSVIFEYKTLLENMQIPENVEEERVNLVKFIKAFESLRNNTILSYLPEYEEFLRRYGY